MAADLDTVRNSAANVGEFVDVDSVVAADEADAIGDDAAPIEKPRRRRRRLGPTGQALAAGTLMVVLIAAVAGWQGYQSYQSFREHQVRELFLGTARQAAVNLTSIGYADAEGDVRKILDSATGSFHDEFQQRASKFLDVVKQTQVKSEGTVTEAAVESMNSDRAQVLVAVSVKSTQGAAAQPPRGWRIRITVEKVGGSTKVSDVGFIS